MGVIRSEVDMPEPLKLFFSVGEESADLHASRLCEELKRQRPDIELFGFGGEKMKAAGVEILYPLPELALIGFVEVVKHLPEIVKVRNLAEQSWKQRKPDAVILVDYPGFNLRLARRANEMGIPVFYYIAPQAWAWKEKRVELMRKTVNRLFVIFPFEEYFFQKHGVNTTYVGHPLVERIPLIKTTQESLEAKRSKPVIALMPGSRRTELRQTLPTLLKTAETLRQTHPDYQFWLPLADTLPESFLDEFSIPDWVEVCRDSGYERRRTMTLAWTASGTATVENALLGLPMAVVFRTNPLNMLIGRRLVRIPYIGMVNLIAQKGICPEFIQEQFQPQNLLRFTEEILSSPARYKEMVDDLAQVRAKMGNRSASAHTASEILIELDAKKGLR